MEEEGETWNMGQETKKLVKDEDERRETEGGTK
jgi:hypothetical protein